MSQTFSIEKSINCPQCGNTLALYFKHTKLIQCNSCKSNIFLENDAARLAGDSSVLKEEPSILSLNEPFIFKQKSYLPLGKIRYSYGRGFWEEWWTKDKQNNEFWLSIDEGDLVLEQKIESQYDHGLLETLHVGTIIMDEWVVTEIGTATCEGFEGSLPKKVLKGNQYRYVHLSGKDAALQTLEFGEDGVEVYLGRWISPFDIGRIL